MPIPDSGTPAAIGFARESGIPFSEGLIKNRYVGRTFIQPDQGLREQGIRVKFNPLDEVAGKRVVVVDDSIVRGNDHAPDRRDAASTRARPRCTSASRLRRSSRPASTASTSATTDAADRGRHARSRTCATRSAPPRLAYLSLEGLQEATRRPAPAFCRACLTREYPTRIPEGRTLAKMRFEPSRA